MRRIACRLTRRFTLCFRLDLRHGLRVAVLPLVGALGLALAPAARADTAWLCNLSEDLVRLICVADTDPLDGPPPAPAAAVATVKGTRFPLDPRQVYTIDLWSPPSEPEWLELLARSSICYRSPGCTVTVAGSSYEALRRVSGSRSLARR